MNPERELVNKLAQFGYVVVRQTGSHIRLELESKEGILSLTIPNHKDLKVGTLSAILRLAAHQLNVDKDDLIRKMYS